MDGDDLINQTEISQHSGRRFMLLMIISISLALILTLASIIIYYKSGSAQLDLSRPGYKEVRSQVVTRDDNLTDIPTIGPANQAFIEDFKILYDQQVEKIKLVEAFASDPLNPDVLWFYQVDSVELF